MLKSPWKVASSAFMLVPACVLAVRCVNPEPAAAAEAERRVQLDPVETVYAVVPVKVTLGGSVVQNCRVYHGRSKEADPITPFRAGDDWIEQLSIYLLNRTNKTIVSQQVLVGFPESAGSGPPRAVLLQLGGIPASAPYASSMPRPDTRQPISFQPGQVIAVHLSDYHVLVDANIACAGTKSNHGLLHEPARGVLYPDLLWQQLSICDGLNIFSWHNVDDCPVQVYVGN